MFQRDDSVVFFVEDRKQKINRFKCGIIRIVDHFAELEDKITCDVFVEKENCLYKHVPAEQINIRPEHKFFLRAAELDTTQRIIAIENIINDFPAGCFSIAVRDPMGNSVLHMPEVLQHIDLVEYALSLGAQLLPNSMGLTPLAIAKQCAPAEVVELLDNASEEKTTSSTAKGVICPRCGRFVGQDAHFCPWCRAKSTVTAKRLLPADYDMDETLSICRECGATARMVHIFCGKCGAALR